MKKISFLILFLISSNIHSYNLNYIGKIESQEWNDILNRFIDYDLTVFAGYSPNLSEKTVKIVIENGFGDDYYREYTLKKCNEKQLKKNKCDDKNFLKNREHKSLEHLKTMLRKSIEWSEVAKKNKVENLSKELEIDGKSVSNPFGYGNAKFYVSSSLNIYALFLVTDFDLSGLKTRSYNFDAQVDLLDFLENNIYEVLEKSKKNIEQEKLFN